MTLRSFMKDIWQLIKDYKLVILATTIVTIIFSLALVIFISRQDQPADQQMVDGESPEYSKVGSINIYADSSYENFQLEPHLPESVIDQIHKWETFRAFFSLNSSDPEITSAQGIDNFFDESSNPIQDFLGIDPTQHDSIKIHPDTGNAYATVEINQDNGTVRLVNVQEGFNDFRIQLDVEGEEGTFAEDIGEDTDNLLHFKVGMTPGAAQLGYVESVYNWTSGVNFPRMLAQRKNFYFVDPIPFVPATVITTNNGLSIKSLVLPGGISAVIGVILGIVLAFMLAIFNRRIKYSFTYGWAADDLYLQYEDSDNPKQITYDMLQSDFKELAVVSEMPLSNELNEQIAQVKGKAINIVNEISDLDLGSSIEEFVLVIQRNETSKKWYDRQRKHLNAYRNKAIKIIEL